MSSRSDSASGNGIGGTGNWLLGGAIGGVVGSLTFGLLLWVVDPTIITDTIPDIYGIEPMGTAGWIFQLGHGLVLGVIFGFIVSRGPILGTITADAETGFLAAMGVGLRFTVAGFVYGLAVWALLPVLVASIGGVVETGFPVVAVESLVGHLLYGLFLGALFALVTDVSPDAEAATAPFQEATDAADSNRERNR